MLYLKEKLIAYTSQFWQRSLASEEENLATETFFSNILKTGISP